MTYQDYITWPSVAQASEMLRVRIVAAQWHEWLAVAA